MTNHATAPVRTSGPPAIAAVAFDDLTARARLREAALELFAEEGYERATVRAIAQTAGVSPGLLRHHYGSKEGLRSACDSYVFEVLQRVNIKVLEDPTSIVGTAESAERFGRYVARSLADGAATAAPIFDEMAMITERWLAQTDEHRIDEPMINRRIRAALLTAMKMGVPLLREHVSRALGVDMFTPEGSRLVALGLFDIFSHNMIDSKTAESAGEGFEGGSG